MLTMGVNHAINLSSPLRKSSKASACFRNMFRIESGVLLLWRKYQSKVWGRPVCCLTGCGHRNNGGAKEHALHNQKAWGTGAPSWSGDEHGLNASDKLKKTTQGYISPLVTIAIVTCVTYM
jgi:hypothetical protein